MSWNFIVQELKYKYRTTLAPDASRPPMQDIPKAGGEWKLPPPLMEGQTIEYRFYDDIYLDAVVHAVAVQLGSRLAWVFTERVKVPRMMVGSFKPEDWTINLAARFAQAREQWLRERATFYLGEELAHATSAEAIAGLLRLRGLTFLRMIYRHHEDLLVNGQKDSTFCGFGCKHKRAGEIVIYGNNLLSNSES